MRLLALLPLFSAALLLAACGDDAGGGGGAGGSAEAGGGHADEDIDAEACEHLGEGPYVEHTAGADGGDAPDVSAEHTAHTIALIAGADRRGGFVSFQAAEAGEYVFFLGADVPLAIRSTSGEAVALEESCDPAACSDACDRVKGRHRVDLAVGTHVIELGPTDVGSVQLVHEAASHAHED